MNNNQFNLTIDYNRLENIPFIKKFDRDKFTLATNQAVKEWLPHHQFYDQIAFIRALECVNGVVQYAYRDKEPYALSEEQTRECMKLSMGVMLKKKLTLPDGKEWALDLSLYPIVNQVRQYYYNGFKLQRKDDLLQFYAHSTAIFNLIGQDRIENAIGDIGWYFQDTFTPFFIHYGLGYMLQFLQTTDTNDIKQPETIQTSIINTESLPITIQTTSELQSK